MAQARSNLVDLATAWTPNALASQLAEGLSLAAYSGREAAFQDGEEGQSFAATAERLTFREQIDYLQQKRPTATSSWLEVLRGMHDRAFVIAGATDQAMLEEFQSALAGHFANGGSVDDFAADFDRIVEKYGWDYRGERNWRIRTIFNTNMRTSFMAGRLKQMRDPDLVKLRPFWQYEHADSRIPAVPRKLHVDWDGLVLLWNDPWWDTHFPPNDWLCSCGVRSLSRGDLRRLGKAGPDTAPRDALLPVIDPASGQMIMQPAGIGYGWDYMPGDRWDRGLVPEGGFGDLGIIVPPPIELPGSDIAEPIADLVKRARPFTAAKLADGLSAEEYVTAFLQPFGATIGSPLLWEDAIGAKLLISDALFRTRSGDWKVTKRGRQVYSAMLAETIMDPDEIWLALREKPQDANPGHVDLVLSRRFIRVDPETGLLAVFEFGRQFWEAVTGFAPQNRNKPDWSYLDKQRAGKLIWKRK